MTMQTAFIWSFILVLSFSPVLSLQGILFKLPICPICRCRPARPWSESVRPAGQMVYWVSWKLSAGRISVVRVRNGYLLCIKLTQPRSHYTPIPSLLVSPHGPHPAPAHVGTIEDDQNISATSGVIMVVVKNKVLTFLPSSPSPSPSSCPFLSTPGPFTLLLLPPRPSNPPCVSTPSSDSGKCQRQDTSSYTRNLLLPAAAIEEKRVNLRLIIFWKFPIFWNLWKRSEYFLKNSESV